MMRKNRLTFLILIILINLSVKGYSQEDYIVNQAKFLQKSNPSHFGMNQLNRVGVLYNSLRINEATAMDNKYAFGSSKASANRGGADLPFRKECAQG